MNLSTKLTAALGAVLLTGVAACGSSGGSPDRSGSGSADAKGFTCPSGGLKAAVEPFEDPSKLTPAFALLTTALSKQLDCKVTGSVVTQYSAEVVAMRNKKVDIAQFGPLGYVFASQQADAQAVASYGVGGGKLSTYTAGIWVPKDSSITTVSQLKGKSLALSDVGSTSGDAFPRYALRQAGLKDSDVKINYAGGHPQSLLALTNGKVDAAEVNTQQEATAIAAKQFDPSKYRQIWKSDDIPNDPITLRGSLDAGTKAAITKALLNLPASVLTQLGELLDVSPTGQLVAVSQSTYQPLFSLAKTLGLTEKDAG